MDEYPSNSQTRKSAPKKADAPQKEVKKVITGPAVKRKKPLLRRFTETFFGGDTRTVISYIMLDVAIPAMKDMVADVVSQGVERKLYGEVRSVGRRSGVRPGLGNPYINGGPSAYHRASQSVVSRRDEVRAGVGRHNRSNFDFSDIVLETRVEADAVIQEMYALLNEYEVVSVADLRRLLGENPEFTDDNWGWFDMTDFSIRRISDGYLLDLARPEPINN